MTNEQAKITQRIETLEVDRLQFQQQVDHARAQISQLDEVIRDCDVTLSRAWRYGITDEAGKRKARAVQQRADLRNKLAGWEVDASDTAIAIGTYRQELARLTYEQDNNPVDVEIEIAELTEALARSYKEREVLEAEQTALNGKRAEAQAAVDRVAVLRQQIERAHGEKQQTLAEAFISGTPAEEDDVNKRMVGLEKEMRIATAKAEAASAALPILVDRLDEIVDAMQAGKAQRKQIRLSYWQGIERLAYRTYQEQVDALLRTVITLRAVASHTGCVKRRIAQTLQDGMTGLRLPVMGKATEGFSLPRDIGIQIERQYDHMREEMAAAVDRAMRG